MAIWCGRRSLTYSRDVAGLPPIRRDDGSFPDELITRPILFADRAFLSLLHPEEVANAVVMKTPRAITVPTTLSLRLCIRDQYFLNTKRNSYHCDDVLARSAVLDLLHSMSLGIHVIIRLA